MRQIERTNQFKGDFKRVSKGRYGKTIDNDFVTVLRLLVKDEVLEEEYRDHALTGDWVDHRDCHIKPDLILIYRKPNNEVIQLVRFGLHSALGI